MDVIVVGGTAGIGLELARAYASRGDRVVVAGRDAARAAEAAAACGGEVRGIALDVGDPHGLAGALADVERVDRLAITAVERDVNSIADYDVDRAIRLATMKLVGYTEVVHALLGRFGDDASILLFGGLAKEKPYPGSTTVTAVNGAVTTMVNTFALELAPIRVNAIHPGIVGDTAYWKDKAAVLENVVAHTPTGRLVTTADVVDASIFLLENRSMNGANLAVDGGWLLG